MATPTYPTPSELLEIHLDVLRWAFRAEGIEPEIRVGSELYRRAMANANLAAIPIANGRISALDANPLKATGQPLLDLAAIWAVKPRPAGKAAGGVLITVSSGTVTIPEGFVYVIGSERYQTTGTGTYADGATVEVQALAGGAGGNQAAGVSGVWESAAIGALNKTAVVDAGGIHDGVNADSEETLRARLLRKLSAAPVGGNWAMAVQVVENASASVEAAYAYPAARGPGSFNIAVTAAGGSRTLAAATLTDLRAALAAEYPGQEDILVTTVQAQYVDISIATTLPLPLSASGVGGGWLDSGPWPAEDCKVTNIIGGGNTLVIDSVAKPNVGASFAIWWGGAVYHYNVASPVAGSAGAWQVTPQGGLAGADPNGMYVSADAVALDAYLAAVVAKVALLGPGQITDLPELLPRALRQPSQETPGAVPSDLTSPILYAVQTAYPEIQDIAWGVRYDAGTTGTVVTPGIPATTADPPCVFIINSIAIRRS